MAKAQTPEIKTDDWNEDEVTAAAAVPPTVKVRCIVHTLPHTGIPTEGLAGLGMQHKEVRDVPEDVALLMQSRGQVEIL